MFLLMLKTFQIFHGLIRANTFVSPSLTPEREYRKKISAEPSEKIILLADDEIMLRDVLAELLESSGFNVIRVTSGTEVLRVLTEEMKVDLLIIDYNMPGMNGLDCVEQVRKLNYKIPIILTTGSLSVESSPDVKKVGVTSLVTKPYEFDTMLSTIRKFI